MDTGGSKNQSIQSLIDWSKWLMAINFLSGAGCIVVLKTACESTGKVGIFFFFAILSFSLSIICCTLFVFLHASQDLKKPGPDNDQFTWLAMLQWILFALGLMFVLVWVGFLSKVF